MKNRGKYVKYKEKLYEGHGEKGERTVRKKKVEYYRTISFALGRGVVRMRREIGEIVLQHSNSKI